jgi:hypothetical protein
MTHSKLALTLAAVSLLRTAAAQPHAHASAQQPDFQGTWNSATATPLERPAQLRDQPFFTPQQAADWERRAEARNHDPKPGVAPRGFASYNDLFYENGTKLLSTLRTSIITEPADGRIPALKPAAETQKLRRLASLAHPQSATDLGLQDQCIVFKTAPPPMLPYIYNSNYQIIQTAGLVMINVEMAHDTRVIHLDRQSHLPSSVHLWLGDSIGRWENGTLIVDTTNFKDGGGYFGDAGGMFGYDTNLHVVERFSLQDPNTLLYRFEVDDPTAYTRPWKGELTMARSSERIFEYACHEGNYALEDLLNGFRVSDRTR